MSDSRKRFEDRMAREGRFDEFNRRWQELKQEGLDGSEAYPAVGNVGLGILIATIAAAGGWVLSRRKGFERAAQ